MIVKPQFFHKGKIQSNQQLSLGWAINFNKGTGYMDIGSTDVCTHVYLRFSVMNFKAVPTLGTYYNVPSSVKICFFRNF